MKQAGWIHLLQKSWHSSDFGCTKICSSWRGLVFLTSASPHTPCTFLTCTWYTQKLLRKTVHITLIFLALLTVQRCYQLPQCSFSQILVHIISGMLLQVTEQRDQPQKKEGSGVAAPVLSCLSWQDTWGASQCFSCWSCRKAGHSCRQPVVFSA